MHYLKVRWLHASLDEPVELWSELDGERREVRKVEVFRGGRLGFADANIEAGGTRLGEGTIPEIEEIAADPQFVPEVVTEADFEATWERATERSPRSGR